jgi:hypothetical protein
MGTIMNALDIKKEDDVDRDIMVEVSTLTAASDNRRSHCSNRFLQSDPSFFAQNADMSIFSFDSKSCAMQHLVANNLEACSETPARSARRIDLTSELTFDDVS